MRTNAQLPRLVGIWETEAADSETVKQGLDATHLFVDCGELAASIRQDGWRSLTKAGIWILKT